MVVRDGDADAVLVGFHRDFDYERLRIAAAAVRRGARLLATNDDATYPDARRADPGRRGDPGRRRHRHGRARRSWRASRTAPMADLVRAPAGRRRA